MATLAVRFGQTQIARNLRSCGKVLFSRKYLLVTNTGISMALSGTGDFLIQQYEILRKRQKSWDVVRTKNISCTGLVIGPACHFWYLLLDRILPGRTVRIILKKIVLDTIIFSPVNISLYLTALGLLEKATPKEIKSDLMSKGTTLFTAEALIWPPAQYVNFLFLPTRFRVLYDNTVSLGFDCYYSYVKHKKDTIKELCEKEEYVMKIPDLQHCIQEIQSNVQGSRREILHTAVCQTGK